MGMWGCGEQETEKEKKREEKKEGKGWGGSQGSLYCLEAI